MTEYVVLIVGDADRWWTTMSMDTRKMDCGQIIAALGDGVQVRRAVKPEDRS